MIWIVLALLLLTVKTNAFSIVTRARLPQRIATVDGRILTARPLQSAPTDDSVEVTKQVIPSDSLATDAIVCGGGPAGLLTAIMLAQKFPEVRATKEYGTEPLLFVLVSSPNLLSCRHHLQRKVKVFDRLGPPPSPTDEAVWSDVARFYLLGLGGRGQRALGEFGVWDEVEAVSTAVVGRKDWSPGMRFIVVKMLL